ncbi:MAG: M28 family peptidase [Candidatus Poseidoniales archaeon]
MQARTVFIALLIAISFSATNIQAEPIVKALDCEQLSQTGFNGTRANESIGFQTSLGPRLPGSVASSILRQSIKENLSGWDIIETTHHVDNMVLTNLFATWNKGAGSTVYFAAHYDTRDRAEKDSNESLQNQPILGANDGASGVAVLLELARQIPEMNLSHEITLFFTDGEDQGELPSFLGARAWSENLSQENADLIESFILIDMVGDEYLTLAPTYPGNQSLWNRTTSLFECDDNISEVNYASNNSQSVLDDHVWAMNKGIPSIDIIDIKYGPNASEWQGYWHTHNDTADKVSADSLEAVGSMLERGLLSGSWLDIREYPQEEVVQPEIQDEEQKNPVEKNDQSAVGIIIMACLIFVFSYNAWLIYAETRGEG